MKKSVSEWIFTVFNYFILILLAALCVLPFIHIIALSLSKSSAVSAGYVKLWPVEFTTYAYQFVMSRTAFWEAFVVTIQRVLLGGVINMVLVIMAAYPLSKEVSAFKPRTVYVWFFFITMLFAGGIVPLYLLLHQLKLLNTMWALVLPTALPVYNLILMLNFFRQIPKELDEAAFVDGALPFRVLWSIYVPCSLPAVATVALFTIVFHWNAWFDGIIYMNETSNYPLQSYLQTVIVGMKFSMADAGGTFSRLRELSNRSVRSAQVIIAAIPVLLVYPLLQKYFVKGIVLGGVKG